MVRPVESHNFIQTGFQAQDFTCLDLDISCLTLRPA
jgi:hypothetical protein